MSLKDSTKQQLLEAARKHIAVTKEILDKAIQESEKLGGLHKDRVSTAEIHEAMMQDVMTAIGVEMNTQRIENYKFLQKTPYFNRCDVILEGTNEVTTFYFAKFPFIEESIYSWVAPAAKMRFEEIGDFNFETVSGNFLKGKILRKDQFMIVDGKIIFMASEGTDYERSLIHQEYLSNRKAAGFAMQDIVAMMERAQDKVIRAESRGSFLISGPAGSGKTTLALHRVAYLTQSPETSQIYPGEKILVFVQDASTKDYFSALLPNLGIENVQITTFQEWAAERLKIEIKKIVARIGENETEKDILEFEKNQALKNLDEIKIEKDYFKTLDLVYKNYFSYSSREIFKAQKVLQVYDRFDLTILLKAYLNKEKALHEEYIDYVQVRKGKLRREIKKDPLNYSLIIIDETQNYLAEQIEVIKTTIDKKTNSMLFVGDLVQQTHLGTIKDWNEVNEEFGIERKAELDKVYRNTKQILEFIKSLGFNVTLAENLRDGIEVKEAILETLEEEANYVNQIIEEKTDEVIGVLVKTPSQKESLSKLIDKSDKVHLMTINESQGVEFDVVILAGIEKDIFIPKINDNYPDKLLEEKKKVNRDLIYVALTRAMNELHVIGKDSLKEL